MHIARFGVIKHNGKHSLSASGQKHHANCYALCGYNLWFCNPIHVPMVLCWRKKMNTRKPVFEFPISSFIHFLCCSHLPTGNSGVFLEATGAIPRIVWGIPENCKSLFQVVSSVLVIFSLHAAALSYEECQQYSCRYYEQCQVQSQRCFVSCPGVAFKCIGEFCLDGVISVDGDIE